MNSLPTRRTFAAGLLAATARPRMSGAARSVIEEARSAIPSIRMRDVEMHLSDPAGKLLTRVPVEIVQTRQAFPFGDQTWELDRMFRDGRQQSDRCRYWKLRFAEVLNSATALCYWTERYTRDAPKTEDFQGELKTDAFAYCVDWAAAKGLTVKGHPLFWPTPKAIPDWVKRYDYATQLKFAEVRVRQLVSRFRGRVKIWDAVNEALWEPSFRHLAERRWPHLEEIPEMAEYIGQVLTWAREEDPDACFVLNDYGLEQDPASGPPVARDGTKATAELQRTRMVRLVEKLVTQGTPPGAIGLQSHPDRPMDPVTQRRLWDQMGATGLPVHITEFGYDGKDTQRAADYVADMMTCAFGHPAVEAFFFWGFNGVSWHDGSGSGHELEPVFIRIRDLLHNQWLTRANLVSDEGGRIRFRGFFGDYSLRYSTRPGMQEGISFSVGRQQMMPIKVTVRFARTA